MAGNVYAYTPTCSGKATISLCTADGKEPSIEKASLVIFDGDDFYWLSCEAHEDCVDCEAVTLKTGRVDRFGGGDVPSRCGYQRSGAQRILRAIARSDATDEIRKGGSQAALFDR